MAKPKEPVRIIYSEPEDFFPKSIRDEFFSGKKKTTTTKKTTGTGKSKTTGKKK